MLPRGQACAPGNNNSAGKRTGQHSRKGNPGLSAALAQAATAAARKKGSYLKEKYWRLKARRGPKRALVAIAHKILIAAYHMLANGLAYRDLGETHLDQLSHKSVKNAAVRKLERLGYRVNLEKAVA